MAPACCQSMKLNTRNTCTGDIGLSDELLAIQEMAEDFAANEFLPHAAEWDATKTFPEDALRAAAALGFGGKTGEE